MSAGFFALLNDALALTKLSVMKTSGVIGDDLALNAKQLSHVPAERELPIVWRVAKGSLLNKSILIPSALLLSKVGKQLIKPFLMLGGAYFCHEGVEKLLDTWEHRHDPKPAHPENLPPESRAEEKERIKQAVKTDLVLSAEIVTLTLGMVAHAPMETQAIAMIASGLVMTGMVYGSVAGLVKIDDAGKYLKKKEDSPVRHLGQAMLKAAPWILKGLTVAGTVAMFTVGGGLLTHGFEPVRQLVEHFSQVAGSVPHIGGVLEPIVSTALDGIGGLLAGITTVSISHGVKHLYGKVKNAFGGGKPATQAEHPDAEPDENEPAPSPKQTGPAVDPAPVQKTPPPDAGAAFTDAAIPAENDDTLPKVSPEQIPPPGPVQPGAHPN